MFLKDFRWYPPCERKHTNKGKKPFASSPPILRNNVLAKQDRTAARMIWWFKLLQTRNCLWVSKKAFQFFLIKRSNSQRSYIWCYLKISASSLQWVILWWKYQKRRYKIWGHIDVSALIGKKVKPTISNAVPDHFLHSNILSSLENFSILALENKTYLLEIKKNFLTTRIKPSLNRNSLDA